jgi:ankyrin repeat protein
MKKLIQFIFIFFSCAILLLNPIFGMDSSKSFNTTSQSSSSNSEINKLFNNTQMLHLLAGRLKTKEIKKIIVTQKNLFKPCINNPIGDKKQTLLMAAIESNKSPKATDSSIIKYFKFYAYADRKKLLVKLLIKNGADVTACDADNNNCLLLAVKTGDMDIINYILKAAYKLTPSKFSSFIKTKNKLGQTVFKLVEYLYKNIPDYNKLIFLGLRKIDDKGNFLTWNLIYDDPDLELTEKTMQIWEQAFVLYTT